MSNTYLRWGMENFSLNGFKGVPVSETALRGTPLPPFRFIRADVLAFLPAAARAGLNWDLIILDPPAFSNSKKMRGALDITRDYPGLIRGALRLLNAGGRLWFSANARHFRLDPEEFRTAEFPSLRIDDMRARMIDEDFRGKKIPACYLFQV
jgi:23S rRNA G2069 N7-methylase RlmK/C1962 C5-methylase RlmI